MRAQVAERTLEVRGLSRRFGQLEVISGLDLELEPGERLAVQGPNGSGKTTLLRCITGTLAPSTGIVLICNYEAGSMEARRRLGVSLSQERSFYLRLSGRDNLLFFSRLRHQREADAQRAVDAVVKELELEEIVPLRMNRCSTGMVQQVALARALLGDPTLLVLDEPTRSLDRGASERLWSALARRPAATSLIATHRREDVERCGRRLDLRQRRAR
jgi:ABC-type multidrug transport system ATPase subunit